MAEGTSPTTDANNAVFETPSPSAHAWDHLRSILIHSPQASFCPPITPHQRHLNLSRHSFLLSPDLPSDNPLRKRVNPVDGTLHPPDQQPSGRPRAIIPSYNKPRPRKDRDAAAYFLERRQLMTMWNSKWTREEDWIAWDRAKAKMEERFGNYRVVERPALSDSRTVERSEVGSERKRKRSSTEWGEQDLDFMKPQHKTPKSEIGEQQDPQLTNKRDHRSRKRHQHSSSSPSSAPVMSYTPAVRAFIPSSGTTRESLVKHFRSCKEYSDPESFEKAVNEVAVLDSWTGMLFPKEMCATEEREEEQKQRRKSGGSGYAASRTTTITSELEGGYSRLGRDRTKLDDTIDPALLIQEMQKDNADNGTGQEVGGGEEGAADGIFAR